MAQRPYGRSARRLRCSDRLKVADHRSRQIQVEFPALHSTDTEAVLHSGWNIDEGPSGAEPLDVVDEDQVLPLQDVEHLRRIVVDMHRLPEAWRLVGLHQRETVRCLTGVRSHTHMERTHVQDAILIRHVNKGLRRHDCFSTGCQ